MATHLLTEPTILKAHSPVLLQKVFLFSKVPQGRTRTPDQWVEVSRKQILDSIYKGWLIRIIW